MSLQIATVVEMIEEQLWQFSIVAMVIAGTVMLCTRRRPYLAYALLIVVMLKAVAPPILETRFALLPGRPWATDSEFGPVVATGDGDLMPVAEVDAGFGIDQTTGPVAAKRSVNEDFVPHTRISPWGVAAAIWLIGVLLVVLIRCAQTARIIWLLRCAECPVNDDLLEVVRQVAQTLGVRQAVRLAVSPDGLGPAAIGIFRPTIILPTALVSQCTPDELKGIIAHELVHIRRRDVAVTLCQMIVQALWWFHPLVHWAHRRMTYERERCTDDAVLASAVCSREEYASVLLTVLRIKNQLCPISGVAVGTSPVNITRQRLERIMSHNRFNLRTPLSCWLVLFVGAALTLPTAAANQGLEIPQAKPGPSKSNNDAESTNTIEVIKRSWPSSSKPLANLDKNEVYPAPTVIFSVDGNGNLSDIFGGDRDVTTIAPEDLYQTKGRATIGTLMSQKQATEWQAAHGVDLRVEDHNGTKLWGHDLVAIPTANESWNETPKNIQAQLNAKTAKPNTSVLVGDSAKLPKTFFFRTREGGQGVMQVLAFTKSEPGSRWFRSAIIRYKLTKKREQAAK
jgi:beta-lactamase regulating signal transducer with metallopeptidase domain